MKSKLIFLGRFIGALSAAVILIGLLFKAGVFSGWFKVKNISVLDNHYLSDSLIAQEAGIGKGADIFSLPLQKGTSDLLKNPYIEGVAISRSLPYTVVIRVKERTPIAAFWYKGKWRLISEDGVVLPLLDEIELGKTPVLAGVDWHKVKEGETLTDEKQAEAYDVVKEMYLNHPLVYALSAEVNFSGDGDLTVLMTGSSGKIILERNRFSENLNKLKLFFKQMNRLAVLEGNEYINLKFKDRIIVKSL
jgi:cell division septal protein FtsQ